MFQEFHVSRIFMFAVDSNIGSIHQNVFIPNAEIFEYEMYVIRRKSYLMHTVRGCVHTVPGSTLDHQNGKSCSARMERRIVYKRKPELG